MILKLSEKIFICFFIFVALMSWAALASYPGKWLIYLLFTVAFNALFVIGFTQKKLFFETFLGIFFWLGFWLKFTVRIAFMGGEFQATEQIGEFSGTAVQYDHALIVSTVGVSALLLVSFIRRTWFFSYSLIPERKKKGTTEIFHFYKRYRTSILISFLVFVIIVAATNVMFGIYQRGMVPRTIIPFKLGGIYTWLLSFGLASLAAVLLDCEFRLRNNPYLVTIINFLESFFSNVSLLSRGMILNGGSTLLGLFENCKRRLISVRLSYKVIVITVFIFLFLVSVIGVNQLRKTLFYQDFATPVSVSHSVFAKRLDGWLSRHKHLEKYTRPAVNALLSLESLLLDRWVGIEGAMAVSNYPRLGWDLWKEAWNEQYSHSGTSMYDVKILKSPFADMSQHHFISLPGIIAFLYYPGSLLFLFAGMLGAGIIGTLLEIAVFKLGHENIILCSLMAQVIAYRYASFGYVPGQSYLFFGALILNILIIYVTEKSLALYFRHKKINPAVFIPERANHQW